MGVASMITPSFYNKKTLCPRKDRGRSKRGTTSDSAYPHRYALTVSNNTSRCVGRSPSSPTDCSGRPLREVFQRIFPLPRTNRQLSGGKGIAYLFPSMCFYEAVDILTKRFCFVKHFSKNVLFFNCFVGPNQPPDSDGHPQPQNHD